MGVVIRPIVEVVCQGTTMVVQSGSAVEILVVEVQVEAGAMILIC